MRRYNLLSVLFFIFTFPLLIASCEKSNPLLDEKYISWMKSNIFLEDRNNFKELPIVECSIYYVGDGNQQLKNLCDQWSEQFYSQNT